MKKIASLSSNARCLNKNPVVPWQQPYYENALFDEHSHIDEQKQDGIPVILSSSTAERSSCSNERKKSHYS